jgi:hypothetical protein
MTDTIEPVPARIDQQQLAQELVAAARADGVELVGPGGLLTGLTKTVLETALDAEMSEHLGYDKHDAAGRDDSCPRHRASQVPPGEDDLAGAATSPAVRPRAVSDSTVSSSPGERDH